MVLIQPEFEIDKKNRVICKFHSNYLQLIDPNLDYFDDMYLEQKATCLTCVHFEKNECYFRKTRIKEIENKRRNKRIFKCRLCGRKIERIFSILYSLYYKEILNLEIPLICCNCYDLLNNGQFLSEFKKLLYLYIFIILTSSFFIFYSIVFIYILNLSFIATLLILTIISVTISIIIFKTLIKLSFIVSGLSFFKQKLFTKSILK